MFQEDVVHSRLQISPLLATVVLLVLLVSGFAFVPSSIDAGLNRVSLEAASSGAATRLVVRTVARAHLPEGHTTASTADDPATDTLEGPDPVAPIAREDGPSIKVCVRAKKPNPRVASLFARNTLSHYGGALEFVLSSPVLATMSEFYKQKILLREDLDLREQACDPSWPELWLNQHETMKGDALEGGAWMVVADEYCFCKAKFCAGPQPLAPLHAYHSTAFTSTYVPLGPQFWFAPFQPSEVPKASARFFPFNFAGSATSHSRSYMASYLAKATVRAAFPLLKKGFVHVKQSWSSNLKSKGYVRPTKYRSLLLNSTLTLCPSGNNPEAFRLHEAIEAGSIPVIALDRFYKEHGCKDAFKPYLDSGAPFIVLKDWSEFPKRLHELFADPQTLDDLQAQLHEWKVRYWTKVAADVDCAILRHHNNREDVSTKYPLPAGCSAGAP